MINYTTRTPNKTEISMLRNSGIFTLQRFFRNDFHIYNGTVSPIISVFVIFVNILLIATLIKGKFRMSTHVMMVSIAVAPDSITGLVPLPVNIYVFGLKKETEFLTLTWCYAYDYFQNFLPEILHISSLHLTVGLGVERFIVVSFPLKATRICTLKNGILFSIAIFILSSCAQIDLFTRISFEPFSIKTTLNSTISGCLRSERIRTSDEYIARVVLLVLLPCLVLIIFTALLLRKSKEIQEWRKLNHATNGHRSATVNSLERLDLAVVFIMFFIVIIEGTVWICFIISRVLEIRFTTSHEQLVAIGYIIFQITSPLNFVILYFLSSRFRDVFKETFCCCLSKWKSDTISAREDNNCL